MPRRHQPPSLRKASLMTIGGHFDDIVYHCFAPLLLTSIIPSPDSIDADVFPPFQYPCDDMIQEVIDILYKRGVLSQGSLKSLLHSNIRRLNLGCKCLRGPDAVLETLGIRCQKLTHLNLDRMQDVKPEQLCVLVTNLPQIISLNLNRIRLDANVMKAISDNCPNLLDLHVKGCDLKDADLLYLCNSTECFPKFRKLQIDEYQFSTETIVHLLKSHRSLESLGYCQRIDYALEQMYGGGFQSSKEIRPEWIHNLLHITIGDNPSEGFELSEAGRLDLTFQCCPFLTSLDLYLVKEHSAFKHVSKLTHLKTLKVSVHDELGAETFSYSVVPILMEIGQNLNILKCFGFFKVSLMLIGKCCLDLESLHIRAVELEPEDHLIGDSVSTPLPYFMKLRAIRIESHVGDISLDSKAICMMLQNAKEIQEINLNEVITLTDEILTEANRKHGFRHLRKCQLDGCYPVSVESVLELLCPDNPLEQLSVRRCPNITRQDMERVQHEAILRHFNINIDFENF